MLVKLISDLHIGYNDTFSYASHGEDVCVLAGDIATGMRGVRWAEKNIPEHILVLYVPGNHEYYGEDYIFLNQDFQKHNESGSNVRILMEESIQYNGVEFFGTTLWTDYRLYNNPDLARRNWREGMNDARWMSYRGKLIHSSHIIEWHQKAIKWLEKVNTSLDTNVLITHYCPDLSVAPIYRKDPLTPSFAAHIPVEVHKKFNFHFHGHTHCSMDYEYPYGTKVKCNPRGYGFENYKEFNHELVLDI